MMNEFFVVNVEVAIFRGDRWLMIQRSAQEEHAAGTLAMVGGKVDPGDDKIGVLEACARREVMEEVGVTIGRELTYLESKSFYSDRKRWVVDVVFVAECADGDPRAIDPGEVAWVGWLTQHEIDKDPRSPAWTRKSMEAAEQLRLRLIEKLGQ